MSGAWGERFQSQWQITCSIHNHEASVPFMGKYDDMLGMILQWKTSLILNNIQKPPERSSWITGSDPVDAILRQLG